MGDLFSFNDARGNYQIIDTIIKGSNEKDPNVTMFYSSMHKYIEAV